MAMKNSNKILNLYEECYKKIKSAKSDNRNTGPFSGSGIQQGSILIDGNRFQAIPERIAVDLIPAEQVVCV